MDESRSSEPWAAQKSFFHCETETAAEVSAPGCATAAYADLMERQKTGKHEMRVCACAKLFIRNQNYGRCECGLRKLSQITDSIFKPHLLL
ncbi:hypothetical protein CDAR_253681 [Caerostris darwini]|uniref:Uncharacterized protein n=1 Tax=Caerostris darwini TaxID=1538125 RepID=A0AAV4Q5D2_9ARAC|nr:hypothetical protein CDAR_253681 [Caerostris darwini]